MYQSKLKKMFTALFMVVVTLLVTTSGQLHSATPICGAKNTNGNTIDQSEPRLPGPFHDLTKDEMRKLRIFLENDPEIKAAKYGSEMINSSYIYLADLYPSSKKETLNFLDNKGAQPPRQARVMMFRGDLSPPVVQEYLCGPLPTVQKCELIKISGRRNPVEFSLRPFSMMEFYAINDYVFKPLQEKVKHILLESYNATFCVGTETDCLVFNPTPVGTGLLGDINKRRMWFYAAYNLPYYVLHTVNFGILLDLDGSDTSQWKIEKLWYANHAYVSVDDLVQGYDAKKIETVKLKKPEEKNTLFSTLYQRGDYVPNKPQRPPLQVEPDGKRYSLKNKQVKYLDWTFNFRMSALTGPSLYDIRFKGERIAYQLGLAEISVFYSGYAPLSQITNYVDSGCLLGSHSKALIPGGDCPESSTLISQSFWSQHTGDPDSYDASFCLFEHNNGYPLRRHSSYPLDEGGFYGGMLDSVLTLRSALTIGNYDYIIDFIFHHNGVVESRLMSTGYIQSSFYFDAERPYGFKLHEHITGVVHHHMAHFRADLDVGGTSNRLEYLEIVPEQTTVAYDPKVEYHQTRYVSSLKKTELEAVYDYNFRTPKYIVVHNNAKRTKYGEIKGYRVQMNGMSYNLLPRDQGNEKSIPWARHQMVVTKHKDTEIWSSSNYGMFDGLHPVVNFTQYYADDENIVDEDMVLWITSGMHHIPHTEDLPVTPTVGNHLSFFLLPYNYFPECPSMGSRDAMYIKHKDANDPSLGVKVDRNGNSRNQCITPKVTLEEDLEKNPDLALESKRKNFIY